MEKLVLSSQGFYDIMVKPHFADLDENPSSMYPGTLGEFTIMDDVSSKRKIIDIIGGGNILKRRDASCKVEYTPVARLETRTVEVDKLYGATETCDEEFYTGCLEDFQSQSDKFQNYVYAWFQKLIKKDIVSNAYFGNIERLADGTGIWSWNVFDGIFKWYARYIAQGVIPASQTSNIAAGAVTPTQAYNILDWAFNNQNVLMRSLPTAMKTFYVSQDIADAYRKYIQQTGAGFNPSLLINGVPILMFNDILILVEPTWNPIMNLLNGGTAANAVILTIKGNFTFATDKSYGTGAQSNEALKVWYSDDDEVWRYKAALKAGTQIALPEHSVIAMTPFS
jgi:hypothetical protein